MHVKVHVYPDSAKEEVVKKENNTYEVYTRAQASGGEANRRVLLLLSRQRGMQGRRMRIAGGHTSRHKIIEVL